MRVGKLTIFKAQKRNLCEFKECSGINMELKMVSRFKKLLLMELTLIYINGIDKLIRTIRAMVLV